MHRVTAIKVQKKDANRRSVFIDNRFAFGCPEELLLSLEIREGDLISSSRLAKIRQSLSTDKIRDKALNYLSRRNRSKAEMKQYLKRKGFEEEEIGETIEWLAEKNYLSDSKFADDWVNSRLQTSPRGRQKLMLELFQKGIDRETAQETVDKNLPSQDEEEVAYQLLVHRKRRFRGEEKLEIKRKIYNFLRYRGFSGSAILSACQRFLEEL